MQNVHFASHLPRPQHPSVTKLLNADFTECMRKNCIISWGDQRCPTVIALFSIRCKNNPVLNKVMSWSRYLCLSQRRQHFIMSYRKTSACTAPFSQLFSQQSNGTALSRASWRWWVCTRLRIIFPLVIKQSYHRSPTPFHAVGRWNWLRGIKGIEPECWANKLASTLNRTKFVGFYQGF